MTNSNDNRKLLNIIICTDCEGLGLDVKEHSTKCTKCFGTGGIAGIDLKREYSVIRTSVVYH